MKLFTRLLEKVPKAPAERLRELTDAKLRLTTERAAVEKQLAQREERREKLLGDDRPEKEILALDTEQDELHVKLEKLDAQGRFLDAEVLKATEAQTRDRWLSVNERRLAAARTYAADLEKAQQSYVDFSQARAESLEPEFRALYRGFGTVPVPPAPPALELFRKQIESLEDFENARQATAVQL